jgi:NADPH2:quinone reductase
MSEVHFVEGLNDAFNVPPKLGHEFGGIVEAVGRDVSSLPVGTLVGNSASFGGFGEVVVAPWDWFQPIAPTIPPHHSCFLEPVSACIHAVQRSRIPLGASVIITGAGSNGLLILQLVRRSGAVRVVVSEPDERRRTLALQLGADEVVNPNGRSLREANSNRAVDVAIETSGRPSALQDCLDVVGNGGRVVMFGVSADSARLELPLFAFHLRDIELIASMGFAESAPPIAAAVLPTLELEPLITHQFGLDEVPAAFECARRGDGVKVLVNCNEPSS